MKHTAEAAAPPKTPKPMKHTGRGAKAAPKAAAPAPKLVRDGFTMPEGDFALIAVLKSRALAGRREAKKSELLRAGLHALAALDSKGLVAALGRLQPVKLGRPKKGH